MIYFLSSKEVYKLKKNIGVDIDGVITDEGKGKDNIWHKSLCNYFGKNIERKKEIYDFTEAFDISSEKIENFLNKHLEKIYREITPAPGARKILTRLKKLGFKFFLITARNEKFNSLTKNWLKKHKIPYHTLIHDDNKADRACKMKIKLFIEDNRENARKLIASNIPVILVNKYHNQGLQNNNLYRVNTWYEINEHINDYFNLDQQSENIC